MVTARRREAADLKERLHEEPQRFDFFQAVRLLERFAREESADARQPVGADGPPEQECVRFRAQPSLSHPAAAVGRLSLAHTTKKQDETKSIPEMIVSFMGLTGPNGVLPPHYTALLMRRLRVKDSSLRDFLDLFNHRLVSLFYRAWEKYRLPIAYERAPQSEPEKIGQALRCLVGRGTAGLSGREDIPEEAFLYYSGHFAHHPRSATALEQIVADYFGLPIHVLQFQGQRLRIDEDDRTRLPSRKQPRGLNCRIGVDTVLGDHVWDSQDKFRLRVGPLTYREFRRFFPLGGDQLRPLSQITRSYVGGEFTFDLQLVLKTGEVPRMRLGGKRDDAAHLGWNTWVAARPVVREADDVVFRAPRES